MHLVFGNIYHFPLTFWRFRLNIIIGINFCTQASLAGNFKRFRVIIGLEANIVVII